MTSSIPAGRALAVLCALLLTAPAAYAQHDGHAMPDTAAADSAAPAYWATLRGGAHAVGLLTHASPILRGESMTEGYLTQPALMGEATLFGGAIRLQSTISLEALTLDRGELGAGNYGEGYVDRRHPHTYLHELTLTASRDVGFARASATIGRGFAPFGTDDPMMRPFVKFPVNHHLSQVLERSVVIGAVRAGPLLAEGGVFSGNEPVDAKDIGRWDRFADSWAARVTIMPLHGVELQGSRAWVVSPELPVGGGRDQLKYSASARYDRAHAFGRVYALGEWASTTVSDAGNDFYSFGSVLGEAAVTFGRWTPALRVERSERPEEERLPDPFRSPWPHAGTHDIGVTTWTIIGARVERASRIGPVSLSPFVEVSRAHVDGSDDGIFVPARFYGDTDLWTFNFGARIGAGWHAPRMGRYGVAAESSTHNH